jgi:TPP-dependent pyruvate/acetoin dehydrogenase alpha subunit
LGSFGTAEAVPAKNRSIRLANMMSDSGHVMTVHREKKTPNPVAISSTTRLDWYRQMCRIRAFEREVLSLNKAGLLAGTAHLYIGMEAVAVGACAAMREGDLLTSTHRGHGHSIACGLDLGRMMAEILGRADGYCAGKGGSMHITDISRGMLGADGIVGGGIPIAVGAALGMRLKGRHSVVFCFFGEGASNQGTFHEALNLAAVNRLPVLFICENNLWALSASFEEVTAGRSVANRAAAYGIPGYKLDGNDVEAVFQTVSASAVRAANGAGPCLIECISYRWESHSIIPRQEIRAQQEIEEWKQRDPVARYLELLLERRHATAEELSQIDAEVTAEVARATAFAKGSPIPDIGRAFQDVYA